MKAFAATIALLFPTGAAAQDWRVNIDWCFHGGGRNAVIKDLSLVHCQDELVAHPEFGVLSRREIVDIAQRIAQLPGGPDSSYAGRTKKDAVAQVVRVCQCHNPAAQSTIDQHTDDVLEYLARGGLN